VDEPRRTSLCLVGCGDRLDWLGACLICWSVQVLRAVRGVDLAGRAVSRGWRGVWVRLMLCHNIQPGLNPGPLSGQPQDGPALGVGRGGRGRWPCRASRPSATTRSTAWGGGCDIDPRPRPRPRPWRLLRASAPLARQRSSWYGDTSTSCAAAAAINAASVRLGADRGTRSLEPRAVRGGTRPRT
jgi:hypothetical protein